MQLTRHNNACATLEIPSNSNEKLSVMLTSDVHYDSKVCDLDLFAKHLKMAEETQSPVLIAGDLLDAMQGKHDPRREIEDLKKEYAVSAYYDAIVADCARFLARFEIPYYILCLGNHETGVLRNSNTDLLYNVAAKLTDKYKKQAEAMGYWGYIRFMFKYKNGNGNSSRVLYWHHGAGANAIVTKGIMDANRQSWVRDADIILNGHNHKDYYTSEPVEKLNQRTMMPYNDKVIFLRTPGYKKSCGESLDIAGFEPEKQRKPTSKGCHYLFLEYHHSYETVEMDIMPKIS